MTILEKFDTFWLARTVTQSFLPPFRKERE